MMLHDLIKNNLTSSNSVKYENVFLPHSGITKIERIKKKIKKVFKNS